MGEKKEREGVKVGWWGKLKEELRPQKNLLLLKAVLSIHTYGCICVIPYMTLHLRQLGITYKEVSIIFAVLPLAAFVGSPISGMVADKTGRYKLVTNFNNVMTAIMTVLLLYVPARPSRTLSLTCHPGGHLLTWSSCDLCHHHRNNTSLQLLLQECEWSCSSPPAEMWMCFPGHNTTCLHLNSAAQVLVNGTVVSEVEGDTCSHVWSEVLYEGHVSSDITCPAHCPIRCQVADPPPCHDPDDPSHNMITFWLYMIVRSMWTLFSLNTIAMLDVISLAIIKERGGDLGKQKVFPLFAASISPTITGALVDWYSDGLGYSDFTPAMYCGAVVLMSVVPLLSCLHFTVEMTESRMLNDLKLLVTDIKVDAFLFLILVFGINMGLSKTYLSVYLEELGAPNYLIGMSYLAAYMSAMPVMFLGDAIVRKLGYHTLFAFAFFVYAFRHFICSFCRNPWVVVGTEIVRGLSCTLPFLAVIQLCPTLAPKGLVATLTSIVSPIYQHIGMSVGSFMGGYLVDAVGLAGTYRIFSYGGLGCGVFYLLFYFCYISLRRKGGAVLKVTEAAPTAIMALNMCKPMYASNHHHTEQPHQTDNHITAPDNSSTPTNQLTVTSNGWYSRRFSLDVNAWQ